MCTYIYIICNYPSVHVFSPQQMATTLVAKVSLGPVQIYCNFCGCTCSNSISNVLHDFPKKKNMLAI